MECKENWIKDKGSSEADDNIENYRERKEEIGWDDNENYRERKEEIG